MRVRSIAFFAITFGVCTAHAQSVADTLVALTGRVSSLEARPVGSDGVNASGPVQGEFDVLNSQKRTGIRLKTDQDGGNFYLYSSAGDQVVDVVTDSSGSGTLRLRSKSQIVRINLTFGSDGTPLLSFLDTTGTRQLADLQSNGLFFKTTEGSTKITAALQPDGLYVFDKTGDNQVAIFGRTADGTAGQVWVNGKQVHDYAEVFEIARAAGLKPGSIVSASADGKGICLPDSAYDASVVGVISGAGAFQPGMQIGSREDGTSNLPVAVSGQVYVRVNSDAGPIGVGDLLVSSGVPGVAMRGADRERLVGTVVGKALEPYSGQGESLIRMLVMLR